MVTQSSNQLIQEFKETYPKLAKRGTKYEPLGGFQLKATIPADGGNMYAIFDGFRHKIIAVDDSIKDRKVGRPKEIVKKDSQIRIRMTPDIKKKLEKIAKITGKTMSEFICSVIEEEFAKL